MTDRPAILNAHEAFVVVPAEATHEMMQAGQDQRNAKALFDLNDAFHVSRAMLAARPDPTALADVVRYVEELEAERAFTLSDASRLLKKQDVQGACAHPDDCFYDTDRVRCGPCAVKASAAKGVVVDDTFSHLPEVCRLRREVKAAEARITALEAALGEAERALEPFAAVAELDIGESEHDNEMFKPMSWLNARAKILSVGNLRAARTAVAKIKETRNAE